jgi:hypothetical protein
MILRNSTGVLGQPSVTSSDDASGWGADVQEGDVLAVRLMTNWGSLFSLASCLRQSRRNYWPETAQS